MAWTPLTDHETPPLEERLVYDLAMYARRTSRVVLFAPNGDVLLLRSDCRGWIPGTEWAWFLPGGGIEPGETAHEAAVREIGEETGIDIAGHPLTHLAFAEGHGRVGDLAGPMRDDVFTVSVTSTTLAPEDGVGQFRWWTVAALRETTEPVFPRQLGATLDRFVSAEEWPAPVRLPW